mmetsp:Transcript_85147/g.264553  ORF Transcript_85147/g.264553 Transcript_85147/m.264553 type:complete len:400 (+) Transcript_85147:118-1317(+)
MGQEQSFCSCCHNKDLDIHEPLSQACAESVEEFRLPLSVKPVQKAAGAPGTLDTSARPSLPSTFALQLHSARITRSVAKVGWMDPYAVVLVDDKEVGRTKPDRWAHKEPKWESSFSWSSPSVPDSLHVAVWDRNRFHKDKLCGAVTIPCSTDMGHLERKDFVLTKKNKPRGSVTLTMIVTSEDDGGAPAGQPTSPTSPMRSLGTELDHMVNWSHSRDPDSPQLLLAEDGRREEGGADSAEDEIPEPPPEVPCQVAASSSKIAPPLLGGWKCVATQGLDEFLKATGVGMFQRKLAKAAKWPSWDFSARDNLLVFVNHSAIGDLREEFPLGQEYSWKDGHGNPMTCIAEWQASPEGGVLLTTRTGAIGSYREERRVTGNLLEFTLTHGTGVSWGRTFMRER